MAWSLFAVTAVLLVAMISLSAGREPFFDTVLYGVLGLSLATAGAFIASRHPSNPIGWLFCVLALWGVVAETGEGWGLLAADQGLAGGAVGEWLISWSWIGDLAVWAVIFVLFPDGRLLDRRWRLVVWTAVVGCALAVPGLALSQESGSEFNSGTNPLAISALPADLLFSVGMALITVALLAAIASLVVRFRRAASVERQQLKWFAYAAGLAGVVLPVAVFFYDESVLVQIAIAVAISALPIAAGVAILRHRLYDIDVVINRTLVYGVLSLLLAGAYAATTLVLGTALGSGSAWATAGATLAVAAAFRPLRARVQDQVDRRFARARYDARRRIADFLEELRSGRAAPEQIEALLREVLEDEQLELRFFLPESRDYVDARGRTVADPPADPRARTPVERAGQPLGMVLHTPADQERPGLVSEVVEAAGLAIEIARLRVELRRQLEQVEASRARIVTAGYEERRRIERDLHDGAQQRLVSIGLQLRHIQHELGPVANGAVAALDRPVEEITLAIAELRELARGVRPAQLDAGLAPALRELAARAPVAVEVRAGGERFPGELEAAAYFIASEGLTNAVKHADPSRVTITAERCGGELVVSVSDDGVGGANPRGGSGLRGLADRVAAYRGTLQIESEPGEGTTLRAELPCAS